MHKTIYVTGITGFIGSNLLPFLLKEFDKVINFKREGNIEIISSDSSIDQKISEDIILNNPSSKLINLATDIGAAYQLQRIGYILDNIDLMDEDLANKVITKLADFVAQNKPKYLPLSSRIPKNKFPRCKKWRIVINTEIESDL